MNSLCSVTTAPSKNSGFDICNLGQIGNRSGRSKQERGSGADKPGSRRYEGCGRNRCVLAKVGDRLQDSAAVVIANCWLAILAETMIVRRLNPILAKASFLMMAAVMCTFSHAESELFPPLQNYLKDRTAEFDRISVERKAELKKIADYVKGQSEANQPSKLTFICTHNSRRSHLSQIWAAVAANYYGLNDVETYSGGTEATAFNPRAIAAIERAGLTVSKVEDGKNPRYGVRFQKTGDPLICFSKVYDEAPNPKEDYCAVMTCSQADKNCPIVKGSALRVAIPFEDPKAADDKPEEQATYDERCQQICREMMYLFSQVKR